MACPYLPADFDKKYPSRWVTVPNSLWDAEGSRGLFQEYIDQLSYADALGFDGIVLNEHHQNIYGPCRARFLDRRLFHSGPAGTGHKPRRATGDAVRERGASVGAGASSRRTRGYCG